MQSATGKRDRPSYATLAYGISMFDTGPMST